MYLYYNRNPRRRKEEDCVCRAISTVLGISYHAADRLINLVADLQGCEPLCVCCYHRLLEGVFGLEVRYSDWEETVGEVAERHRKRKVLIRLEGHLTCAVYGDVLDIWDCTGEPVDCYWII